MDHLYDSFEDIGATLFDKGHELFDLLVFWFVDNKFVDFFHVVIEFFSEFWVCEEGVADLDVAVVLVIGFLVFA